jgi:hypothetical protein
MLLTALPSIMMLMKSMGNTGMGNTGSPNPSNRLRTMSLNSEFAKNSQNESSEGANKVLKLCLQVLYLAELRTSIEFTESLQPSADLNSAKYWKINNRFYHFQCSKVVAPNPPNPITTKIKLIMKLLILHIKMTTSQIQQFHQPEHNSPTNQVCYKISKDELQFV